MSWPPLDCIPLNDLQVGNMSKERNIAAFRVGCKAVCDLSTISHNKGHCLAGP